MVDAQQSSTARYLPTPIIVEAARAFYAQHSVEAIARYDAGAENLRMTSRRFYVSLWTTGKVLGQVVVGMERQDYQ
jgi:hypothetical protein